MATKNETISFATPSFVLVHSSGKLSTSNYKDTYIMLNGHAKTKTKIFSARFFLYSNINKIKILKAMTYQNFIPRVIFYCCFTIFKLWVKHLD